MTTKTSSLDVCGFTANSESDSSHHHQTLISTIDMQVRGQMDRVRAKPVWKALLIGLPSELIAQVLADVLSGGHYQPKPKCRSCMH